MWYELGSSCIHCNKDDYSCSYGPRSLLLCSCCPKGTHVECYEKAKGLVLTEEFIDSGSSWFCCKVSNMHSCVTNVPLEQWPEHAQSTVWLEGPAAPAVGHNCFRLVLVPLF